MDKDSCPLDSPASLTQLQADYTALFNDKALAQVGGCNGDHGTCGELK